MNIIIYRQLNIFLINITMINKKTTYKFVSYS